MQYRLKSAPGLREIHLVEPALWLGFQHFFSMGSLHFEVGHVLRTRALPEDEFKGDGPVKRFDRSNVMRLSHSEDEFFPSLQEKDLGILKKACHYAQCSEEFFLTNINARNEWLRTVIRHTDNLDRNTYWTKAKNNELDSDIIIHSNILPYDPYWSKLDDEWTAAGMECEIGIRKSEEGGSAQLRTCRKKTKAAVGNDKDKKRLARGDAKGIWKITLKGGQFIGKTGVEGIIQAELNILNKIKAHPHIVYFFDYACDEAQELCEETVCVECEEAREAGEGTSQLCQACEETRISAFFMEFMTSDLRSFILDRIRMDSDKPPFKPEDAVDILLQISKAMKHIHDKNVNVVHCDLKSENILICEIPTRDKKEQYLVKVADFGSAQPGCRAEFKAGDGTTAYSSPEALKQRKDKNFPIEIPHGIDVYSFGIVAFEVLTGDFKHIKHSRESPSTFKKGVLVGVRPPICEFIQDNNLMLLLEKCWHERPSERPTFATVCEELVRVGAQQVMERSSNPANQAKSSNGGASVGEQVVDGARTLVHVGAGTKKASGISKALHSAKSKVSMSKIKAKIKNIGRRNPGVKVPEMA